MRALSIPGVIMARIYKVKKRIEQCGSQCPAFEEECDTGHGCAMYTHCTKYKKEIYGNIVKNGFPTFCELAKVK